MGTNPKIAPNQKWAEQEGLNAKTLQSLYAEMSDREIAVKFGVSDAIIGYYRKKWGIPTMTARQRARPGTPTCFWGVRSSFRKKLRNSAERQSKGRKPMPKQGSP
jgi:hypothetical protein